MDGFLNVLAVLGFVVTVGGFGATLYQLSRTRTAAEATERTVVSATDRVRYNQLLVLLPQLQNLEPELDAAMREDDSRVAERTLVRWNQLASQTQGIVSRMGGVYQDLADALGKSCDEAVEAKGQLVEGVGSVKDVTRSVRATIASLSVALGRTLGSLATEASNEVRASRTPTGGKPTTDPGAGVA